MKYKKIVKFNRMVLQVTVVSALISFIINATALKKYGAVKAYTKKAIIRLAVDVGLLRPINIMGTWFNAVDLLFDLDNKKLQFRSYALSF